MTRLLRQFATLILLIGLLGACNRVAEPEPTPTLFEVPQADVTAIPLPETDTPADAQDVVDEASEPSSEPTEDAEATETPFAPKGLRLTDPGCCAQPFWSPDGQTILFIDKPRVDQPAAIYGVPIEGGAAFLASEQIGLPSPAGTYLAYQSELGDTMIQDVASGESWMIPSQGLRVFFSPGETRLAWAQTARGGSFDQRPTTVSVSNVDGSDVQEVMTLYGGGFAGWIDDDTLLLAGRDRNGQQDLTLFTYKLSTGERLNLISNQRIRSVQVSPGGEWVVYNITLHPEDSSNDGLWVLHTSDPARRYKLEVFGAAQWRDASQLLVIPFEPDAPSHQVWQFDAETGLITPITDPVVTGFRIANGDWRVSPSGEHVVFVSEEDNALWLMELPPID